MLAGEWLLQLELSERTSSLLPAFVHSTSYCRAVQLSPGGKGWQATGGGYYLHAGENKRRQMLDEWIIGLQRFHLNCQAVTELQTFISLIVSQASSKRNAPPQVVSQFV